MSKENQLFLLNLRTQNKAAFNKATAVSCSILRKDLASNEKENVRERLVKTLGDLVKFKTIADGKRSDQMRGLFDYVSTRVQEVQNKTGRTFITQEYDDGSGSISTIITPKDENRSREDTMLRPKIAMLIHADVVPAQDDSLFSLRIEGDKLIGRGANDMKGPLAIGLDLLESMPVGCALVVTSDEEVGGRHGAGYLSSIGLRPDFMIVLDGRDSRIGLGLKGFWMPEVTFNSLLGVGGHASRPHDFSANHFLVEFLSKLDKRYKWKNDESPFGTTFNAGVIQGGDAANVVATTAVARLDFRFPTEKEEKKLLRYIRHSLIDTVHEPLKIAYPRRSTRPTINFIESVEDEKRKIEVQLVSVNNKDDPYTIATVETKAYGPIYHVDRSNPQLTRFVDLIEEVTGEKAEFNPMNASSNDARYFSETPSVITKLPGGDAHAVSEWVSLNGMVSMREVLKRFMEEQYANYSRH